jgi:hypothetical protein
LAASAIVVPSVADAAGPERHNTQSFHGSKNFRGPARGNFRGRGGPGYYGGNGYYGGYYPVCGPIQMVLGLCGPWGY